ncbi:CIC11C00000001437 [Sungouiella intermedia]|uniref:CIC11C00000001437 n=1 Tax=Sungouiella intermedia TaxID=45354 RepID=A0A1L0D142_9ASCO|nr:CIC11C00000001437 [[Candida] intermedia]
MDDDIATFLAFTGTDDAAAAKKFLEISGNNVEYAVQLFMESGNHSSTTAHQDEEIAQKLQQEAYQDNVREADTNVHRHETLLDSFPTYGQMSMPRELDIFGGGRVGIFNQRFDMPHEHLEYDDDEDYEDVPQFVDSDEDSDELMQVDEVGERVRQPRRRVRLETNAFSELSSTQRRLAELFKPPFDLIERVNLDTAKMIGRKDKKWILINIQNQAEFQCQVLNRDFWANEQIKKKVKEDFIFLQYQHDSVNGESFVNFYHVDQFPHISILDPMTGERVFKWTDGKVPDVEEWLADVELFMEKFSLQPSASNPLVKHEVKFDPDSMTEEQQIEFAMRQSVGASGNSINDAIALDDDDDEVANNISQAAVPEPEQEEGEAFDKISAKDHDEPSGGSVTRIQFRFPSGKRLIHKFDFENDTVGQIYQWLKFVLLETEEATYGIGTGDRFTMSSMGKSKLLDMVDMTIGEAGLKNASILLEKE